MDRTEIPQCTVSFIRLFADVVHVGKLRVEGEPRVFDLICPINVRMKEF
jgi:hypothetical protein